MHWKNCLGSHILVNTASYDICNDIPAALSLVLGLTLITTHVVQWSAASKLGFFFDDGRSKKIEVKTVDRCSDGLKA